ncbi:MAG: hypothetical protein ACI8YQ_004442 [Polaribacter sp.]|jgi:uncharacterized protein YndB with AHSA1/START domain
MNIKVELTIKKPIQEVWEVMGNQYGYADKWSSNFKTSKPGGEAKFSGLEYSFRDTTTDRGNTIQELTVFDPDKYRLSYVITKGAPEIAKMAGAEWSLVSESENGTMLSMDFIMEPKMPLTVEMETKIKKGLTASVKELAEELKFYLETGKPLTQN